MIYVYHIFYKEQFVTSTSTIYFFCICISGIICISQWKKFAKVFIANYYSCILISVVNVSKRRFPFFPSGPSVCFKVDSLLQGLGLPHPTPKAVASPEPASFLNGILDLLTPLLCGIADLLGEIITGVLYLVAGLAHGILNWHKTNQDNRKQKPWNLIPY